MPVTRRILFRFGFLTVRNQSHYRAVAFPFCTSRTLERDDPLHLVRESGQDRRIIGTSPRFIFLSLATNGIVESRYRKKQRAEVNQSFQSKKLPNPQIRRTAFPRLAKDDTDPQWV